MELQGKMNFNMKYYGKTAVAFITAVLMVSVLSSTIAKADVYKYVDKNGHVYLTDRPNHKGYRLLIKTWKGWREKRTTRVNLAKRQEIYKPIIKSAATQHRLPSALVHAVIFAESAYNPEAVSSAGAVGMMQLMPETAKRFGVANSKNAQANIQGGTRYLRLLLDMFNNNLDLALAAYNAGEGAVMKYGNTIPPYKETQHYVKKVKKYYKLYSATL